MPSRTRLTRRAVLLCPLGLILAGCGSKPSDETVPADEQGLRELAAAYRDYFRKNKRGPRNLTELQGKGQGQGFPNAICMVMSGTWWVNSGADFDSKDAVPVPAGGFVKRTARTYHYDGVPAGIKEPVVIAIFGIGPVDIELADPKLPSWRRV